MASKAEELLTVVIPVYNREKVVMRTLESLERQKVYPSVILVDNNSTDGTYGVLERWVVEHPQIPARLLQEERRGATNARNCGLSQVATPWVMFFDSDDRMLPDHLSKIIDGIRRYNDTEVGILGWDIKMSFETGGEKVGIFRQDNPVFYSLFAGSMATARWAARTSLVRQAGGWNPEIELWDDIDLGLRMLRGNPSLVKLHGEPTVDVFVTRDSITAMRYYDDKLRLEHTIASLKNTLEERPEVVYIPLLKAIYAAHYYKEGQTAQAKRFYKEASAEAHVVIKPMMAVAYFYTRMGGRGIARILRRLIPIKK